MATRIRQLVSLAIGLFVLSGGISKFPEAHAAVFGHHIGRSGLPPMALLDIAGSVAAIAAGLTLLILGLFWSRISEGLATVMFTVANVVIVFILPIAIFLQVHPAIAGDIVTIDNRVVISTAIATLLAFVNLSSNVVADVFESLSKGLSGYGKSASRSE